LLLQFKARNGSQSPANVNGEAGSFQPARSSAVAVRGHLNPLAGGGAFR
jgi:hypothetical protein